MDPFNRIRVRRVFYALFTGTQQNNHAYNKTSILDYV